MADDPYAGTPLPKRPKKKEFLRVKFGEAPLTSIEVSPMTFEFPIQTDGIFKANRVADNSLEDDYCFLCLDGSGDDGTDELICCDYQGCPRVFHQRCHIPLLFDLPEGDWMCNYHTTKVSVMAEINSNPDDVEVNSDILPLVEDNKKPFILACKLLMECFKIPEAPTMRWNFPDGYLKKYGKVPYHLEHIRLRLCYGNPEPFKSVAELFQAFMQMIHQALMFYDKLNPNRKHAIAFKVKFLKLFEEYWPSSGGTE